MRIFLFILFTVFAVPAVAQQERECRGKQGFNLGDGAYGCLFEAKAGSLTTTTTRDDGASQKVKSRETGFIRVAMFGNYSASRQTTGKRITAVCQTFLPNLKEAMTGKRYHRIIVALVWPRIENPGDFISKERSEVAAQVAYTSATCRGVKFVG